MILEGDDAIALLRKLCGSTRAEDAAPGTIRGDYAMHTGLNIIHASDSPVSAEREIALFFKPEEIMDWQDGNDTWI
jgi:nucleoside-diphosphate kinase